MISIEIAGEFLDLKPDTKVNINLASPLFSREIGWGSHSYSFSIPATAKNSRLLAWPGTGFSQEQQPRIEARIYLGGSYWQEGLITIESITPKRDINIGFAIDAAWLSEKVDSLALKDLNLGGLRRFGAGVGSAFYDYRIDITGAKPNTAIIEVNGTLYSYTVTVSDTEQSVLNAIAAQIVADVNNNATALVFFSTWWQIKISIIDDAGSLDIDDNPPSNNFTWLLQASKTVLEANQEAIVGHMDIVSNAALGAYPYCFAPIKNPAFFSDDVTTYSGYVNLREPGGSHESNTAAQPHRTVSIPFVRVKYLIDQALAELGLRDISSSFTFSAEYLALFLYNNKSIDVEGGAADPGASPNGLILYLHNEFNLAEHVPEEMSVGDLFRELARLFNLYIFIDFTRNEIAFEPRAISSASGGAWQDKTLTGYSFSFSEEKPVTYAFKPDTTDGLWEGGRDFESIEPANSKVKIEVALAPLFEQVSDSPGATNWKTCEISQRGAPAGPDQGPGSYNPRIFYYLGLQQASGGSTYPASCSNGKNYNGTRIINQELGWGGANGLYNLKHAAFEKYLYPTRVISSQQLLSLTEIRGLAYAAPYDIRLFDGEMSVIVRKLSFTAEPNRGGKVIAQLESIKL